ncbi:hypothetical protein HMPREF0080_01719 [Anaeroglobus geminatus F0357]|uniref:Uncharacterized protein n=1 Tax=Anaeroglobus geminatus F0357 TaxID=861450 RepID=G9YJ75_9FIRM|nr:hypothetical protein HMPREF0080_01719 [Anaeroglobus geminatus F0357]
MKRLTNAGLRRARIVIFCVLSHPIRGFTALCILMTATMSGMFAMTVCRR